MHYVRHGICLFVITINPKFNSHLANHNVGCFNGMTYALMIDVWRWSLSTKNDHIVLWSFANSAIKMCV